MPILGVLRDHDEHKLRVPSEPTDFVFPAPRGGAFTPSQVRRAAAAAWANENKKRAEDETPLLVPIQLHECRHTCVSIFAAGGVPLERVADYVGHSSTHVTDVYRHLIEAGASRIGGSLTTTSHALIPPRGSSLPTGSVA